MSWIKDWAISGVITLVLLLIINFVFVYISPAVIPTLPPGIIPKFDKCYRTLLHTNQAVEQMPSQYTLVVGDSYTEGSGDEHLQQREDYGFVRKLDLDDTHYIVAGRSGYGSVSSYNEATSCPQLLSSITGFSFDNNAVDEILFAFYEGNDLNNNAMRAGVVSFQESLPLGRKLRIVFPLFDLILQMPGYIWNKVALSTGLREYRTRARGHFNTTTTGIEVPVYPESAGMELTDAQAAEALKVTEEMLGKLATAFPNARINMLYLPSVATPYDFEPPLRVQEYDGGGYVETTNEAQQKRSRTVRSTLAEICAKQQNCGFCDPTDVLREAGLAGERLHGPTDWKHFSTLGNTIVAREYLACRSALPTR